MEEEEPSDELGEGDIEEQVFEDEYEDIQRESTAPTKEDPGITVKQYICQKCGKKTREAAKFLPPVHCGVPMKEIKEYEREISFPKMVPRKKAKAKKIVRKS